MERLRDVTNPPDERTAYAANLVRSARLPEPSPARKARVRAAVHERLARVPRRLVLRPAMAVLLLLLTTAAAASVTYVVVTRLTSEPRTVVPPPGIEPEEAPSRGRTRSRGLSLPELPSGAPSPGVTDAPPPVEPVPGARLRDPEPIPAEPPDSDEQERPRGGRTEPSRSARALSIARADEAPESKPAAADPAPPVTARPVEPPAIAPAPAAPAPVGPPRAARSPRPAPAATAPAPSPAPPSPAEEPEDPELAMVRVAFHALRNRGDARTALDWVERYLATYPEGALLEEALGLAIEAAAALGEPRAAAFAKRYLRRFPAGRFREAAEHAQRRFR